MQNQRLRCATFAATALLVSYLLLILLLPSAPARYVSADSQIPSFSFHNQSSFKDESNILHVLGEVTNESDRPLKDIVIQASFYDAKGTFLGNFTRASELSVINPKESSPFEILYIDSTTVDSVKNYNLTATGTPTEPKEKLLRVTSTNTRLDLLGTYYIYGQVKNSGSETANNTIVIATLYDSEGRVIASSKALAEAPDHTSNVESGEQVPFGIPVTDKSQTYKAKSYALVADSDQYLSNVFLSTNPSSPAGASTGATNGSGQTNTTTTPSGCLIATAAFGSEIAPQVQFLRGFRDGIVQNTFAGSSFMDVFNRWYYSFSPSVADYERGNPWLRESVKTLIYPLLSILSVSSTVHQVLANFGDETAMIFAGLVASSLIGAVYFLPLVAGLKAIAERRNLAFPFKKIRTALVIAWAISITFTIAGEVTGSTDVMMVGSSMAVLSALSSATLGGIYLIERLRAGKTSGYHVGNNHHMLGPRK